MVVDRLVDAIDYRPTFEVIVLRLPIGLPEVWLVAFAAATWPPGGCWAGPAGRACRGFRAGPPWPRDRTEEALAIEPWLTPSPIGTSHGSAR